MKEEQKINKIMEEHIIFAREALKQELGREPTAQEVTKKIQDVMLDVLGRIKSYQPNYNLICNFESLEGDAYLKTMNLIFTLSKLRLEQNISMFGIEGNTLCLKHMGILEQSHLFKIDDDNIINLIMNTNNKIFKRKLPFPTTFINNSFEIDNCIINGILIYSVHNVEGDILGETVTDKNLNIAFFCLGKDKNDDTEFYKYGYLENFDNFKIDGRKSMTGWNGEEFNLEDLKGLDSKIKLLICNLLDFINSPDVQIIQVERTKEQNEKRIKRGKLPIPQINYVRITGKLKMYLEHLNSNGSFSYSHKFWVRGHFRTLRNEERYGDNIGTRIWIPPYVKGQGILLEKYYQIKTTMGDFSSSEGVELGLNAIKTGV